jgi:isochorismate synthase
VQTLLIYRFPNNSIIEKKGIFKQLDNPELFEGFIISDFEGNNFYGFYENESGEELSVKEGPIVISQSAYFDLAHEFIHYLQNFNIGKAVLSRVKQVDFQEQDRLNLFYKLIDKYPNAFCYSFDSPSLGKWIGATPETLIKIEEGIGQTMSLAGTKPVSDTSKWGEKEIYEQQLVTDFIKEELTAVCDSVSVSERDELIAGPVKHLIHRFSFYVSQKEQWNLIQRLHPTPAVSGFPRTKALKCIENFEPHNRAFYAGIIGWKTNFQTNLFVNLRSAQIMDNKLYLYVGGGLTQQSVPESEWEETENKAKTLFI